VGSDLLAKPDKSFICQYNIFMNLWLILISAFFLFTTTVKAESTSNIKVTTKNQVSPNEEVLDIQDINNEIDQFFNDGSNRTEINQLLNTVGRRVKRDKKINKKSKKATAKNISEIQKIINSANPSKEIDKGINSTVSDFLNPGQDTVQIELMGTP
jgi:hypothetical protein